MIFSRHTRLGLRKLRSRLSHFRRRFRKNSEAGTPVFGTLSRDIPPLEHPVIGLLPSNTDSQAKGNFLEAQKELSFELQANPEHAYFLHMQGGALPPLVVENMLLTAAVHDLSFCRMDWPASGEEEINSALLLRNPAEKGSFSGGRILHYPGQEMGDEEYSIFSRRNGWFLAEAENSGIPLYDPEERLADLPEIPGARTVLFLLPFLAIGGAEALLLDLLAGLKENYRILIVTLDPHRPELGEKIGAFEALTPHLYLLGDYLPREARIPALRHLLRRWKVETLFSWNGTIDFYDHVEEIRRDFPDLRILDQHYNHEGAWLDWLNLENAGAFDGHVGINRAISRAIVDRGMRAVSTIPHAVALPRLKDGPEAEERRRRKKGELGIPESSILVGSFMRLHSQKRPLDLLKLARSLASEKYFFLLIGGGPEEDRLQEAIQKRGCSNFLKLPFSENVEEYFEALDLCLLVSSYEGLPVFLLEGMAREIPCVATEVGEIPELFRDGGGLVSGRPGDLEAVKTALLRFRDPGTRKTQGKRGRRTIERFHALSTYVESYERLIFP